MIKGKRLPVYIPIGRSEVVILSYKYIQSNMSAFNCQFMFKRRYTPAHDQINMPDPRYRFGPCTLVRLAQFFRLNPVTQTQSNLISRVPMSLVLVEHSSYSRSKSDLLSAEKSNPCGQIALQAA